MITTYARRTAIERAYGDRAPGSYQRWKHQREIVAGAATSVDAWRPWRLARAPWQRVHRREEDG